MTVHDVVGALARCNSGSTRGRVTYQVIPEPDDRMSVEANLFHYPLHIKTAVPPRAAPSRAPTTPTAVEWHSSFTGGLTAC